MFVMINTVLRMFGFWYLSDIPIEFGMSPAMGYCKSIYLLSLGFSSSTHKVLSRLNTVNTLTSIAFVALRLELHGHLSEIVDENGERSHEE